MCAWPCSPGTVRCSECRSCPFQDFLQRPFICTGPCENMCLWCSSVVALLKKWHLWRQRQCSQLVDWLSDTNRTRRACTAAIVCLLKSCLILEGGVGRNCFYRRIRFPSDTDFAAAGSSGSCMLQSTKSFLVHKMRGFNCSVATSQPPI